MAERCPHQIVDMGFKLMAHTSMPSQFGIVAFNIAVFFINRLPTPILRDKFPYELVHGVSPSYNFV